MKISQFVAATVALMSGHAALACTCGAGTVQQGDVCVAAAPTTVLQHPKATATAGASASQSQGQGQAQGQSQTSTGGNSTSAGGSAVTGASTSSANGGSATSGASTSDARGGNAQGGAGGSSAAQGGANSDSYTSIAPRAPVSTALAGFQQTTAGCRFAEGLGLQLTSAGTSVGFTFKDHDCVRFELAQFFYSRGQDIAGDRIICAVHEVRQTLGDDCEALVHEIVLTRPVDAVTHAELATFGRAIRSTEGVAK